MDVRFSLSLSLCIRGISIFNFFSVKYSVYEELESPILGFGKMIFLTDVVNSYHRRVLMTGNGWEERNTEREQ
jgi:hypothetical protein